MKRKALIIGSTAVDVIIEIDSLPKTGDDVNTKSQILKVGGCAYNVASMLSYLSKDFDLLSPVGMGYYGDFVNQTLLHNDFSTPLNRVEEDNGCCYCFVEKNGERSFVCHRGAEYIFRDKFFKNIDPMDYDIIYFCGLDITSNSKDPIVRFLEDSRKTHDSKHQTIFFAPGPQIESIPKSILEKIFALNPILHLSESEFEVLTNTFGSTTVLLKMTKSPLIVTRGADGATLITMTDNCIDEVHIPAQPVKNVIDTIGAGDAHAGSVISCMLDGQSLPESISFANTMAARVIQVKGSTLLK